MLPRPQKQNRNPRRVHHANQRTHHIAHRIALTNHEPIQPPPRPKRGVEVSRLRHRVRPDQRLAHHQDLIRARQLGELLERRHQALVVVAAAGGVDEHDVEAARSGVRDGVAGDVGRVLAVALFVQLDAAALARRELLQVAGVHAQLLDGAGAEGVAGGDEDAEAVLEQEEGDFGEVGGFADAVDADDGDDVGAGLGVVEGERGGVGDGLDFAEEVERGCWGEDFAEGGFHGGVDGGFDGWGLVVLVRILHGGEVRCVGGGEGVVLSKLPVLTPINSLSTPSHSRTAASRATFFLSK